MSRDLTYLLDITRAVRLAISFVKGYDRATFYDDDKTQSAVLHQLLLIGEVTKRLSDSLKSDNPDIPWRQIAGMRDKLIHDYDDVDLSQVWKTVQSNLPELLSRLEQMIPNEEQDSNEFL